MVPAELGAFERGYTEYDENRESYHLLYHLQLDQGKWAAVAVEADSVSRHLEAIFYQSYAP